MKLSVIILNYNVRFFLEQCILSVQRSIQKIDAEIIVVDNNSSDNSAQLMETRFPNITFLQNKNNVGFSKANNQGVALAKGEYVCILNPDTAVAETTFENLLKFAEMQKNLGAVGTYLLDGTGAFLPESKRNIPSPIVSLKKMLSINWGTKHYYATEVAALDTGKIPVLVGAFMLLKREVFELVKGFDETYFMYGEDIDLSYKLTQAGFDNYYVGNCKTLHYKGESTVKDHHYINRFYGAMQIFYKKHFNPNILLRTVVSIGVLLAKTQAKFKKKKITKQPNYQTIYVFTKKLDLLQSLSKHFDKPIEAASANFIEDRIVHNSLLIFDADYLTYGHIFKYMSQMSNKNNYFKIKPPGCSYLLGSDASDSSGSILHF